MTIVGATTASRDALNHLRSVKPNDGWSIEIQENKNDDDGLRLLRRNAPLTDHYFLDMHHSPKTNTVVGVLTKDGDTCQILVDGSTGRPVLQKSVSYVSCATTYKGYKPLTPSERRSTTSTTTSSAGRSTGTNRNRTPNRPATGAIGANPNANPFSDLSEEDKQLYMKYATMGVGGCIGYKILSNMVGDGFLFFLIMPVVYVYGLQTCPENSTFDAKKEVKRVLRGHHLPDDHPSKPRKGNFLEEWTAKITASVATEVSAAAGGYSFEIAPLLGGCAKHAVVTLPTLGLTCEWIGFNDTWYHYRTYTPELRETRR
jgi:hypothetical protein